MTTINTTEDLLSLLNKNHEFREAVRRAILTEELMALPAVFSSFASEVRSDIKSLNDKYQALNDGQRDLNDKYQALSDGQRDLNDKYQTLSDGQRDLREGQRRHTNDIGELKGIGLETKLYNRGPSLIATLLKVRRSERVRVAETDDNSEEFNSVIYKAQDDGIINNDEYERLPEYGYDYKERQDRGIRSRVYRYRVVLRRDERRHRKGTQNSVNTPQGAS